MRCLTVGSAQVAPGWGFCSYRSNSLARHHPPWVLLWVLESVPGGPLHGCPGACRSHGPKGGSRPLPSHVTVAPEQKESQRRFWQPLPTLLTDFLPPQRPARPPPATTRSSASVCSAPTSVSPAPRFHLHRQPWGKGAGWVCLGGAHSLGRAEGSHLGVPGLGCSGSNCRDGGVPVLPSQARSWGTCS